MEKKRVVVTGMGMVSPLGNSVKSSWYGIINSKSGIRKIQSFEVDKLPDSVSKVAGEVRIGEGIDEFNPDLFIEKKEQRKMGKFMWLAMGAAEEALNDSNWKPTGEEDLSRTGVFMGSGIGGLDYIQNTCEVLFSRGANKISPFFVPASLINLSSGHISIKYGFTGPNQAMVTACASGSHAIGESGAIIARGDADIMVCGGSESTICELGVGGFSAMHALSTTYTNTPEQASRPWSKGRDGFVIAEGAGVLILEEYEHAKKRNAKIYAELVGFGSSGDAYNIVLPEPNGKGQIQAMEKALKNANITPDKIDYINAHGTSTPKGDIFEFNSVKKVFANSLNKLSMSSTKAATGHTLGAAGAIEAIFSIIALRDSILPPTLNLVEQDEECQDIDLVPLKAKQKDMQYVLSNSFGFGGTNASLIFKKF
jgi:3-oxoacyl-[acyl-carrier-protein] synthase II